MTDNNFEIHEVQAIALPQNNEIDMQIMTAKRFPRSIGEFQNKTLELATIDEETAESMFYTLPRAGKKIEGPSIRLAEIAASSWTNLRYKGSVLDVGAKFLTAEGMAYDLETNVAASVQVRRKITDKYGVRFSEDMIVITGNAAISIATRNAIFKVIPFGFVKEIYAKAKQVSLGDDETIEKKRERFINKMAEQSLTEDDVLKIMGRKSRGDLSIDDLIALKGIYTALKEGDTTKAELLGSDKPGKVTQTSPTAEQVKAAAEAKKDKKKKTIADATEAPDAGEYVVEATEAEILKDLTGRILAKLDELHKLKKSDKIDEIKKNLKIPQMITDIDSVDLAQELFEQLSAVK